MNGKKLVITASIGVLIALGLGFWLFNLGKSQIDKPGNGLASTYPLLSTRIFANNAKDPLINFSPLRSELRKYFSDNHLKGSLYFEYLHTGTEVRISGDEQQEAASLLKVPLSMELYKASELGLIDLKTKISLREEWLDSAYGTLYQKGAGYTLTLEELAKIMLTDSDNTALQAIASTMEGLLPSDESVFIYLDASITQAPDLSVSIGARTYSSILKCLYFSCYVNYDHSELLLSYLTETKFNDRLVAGIDDKSIEIAHKIGVFQEQTQSDCGIIYLPNRPYVLCVMIDGEDNAQTNKHIAELSKKAYQYVLTRK